MFIKWHRDQYQNIVVIDSEFSETIDCLYGISSIFRAIIDVYRKRNRFSSRMITRLYLFYYNGIENLPYISSYIKEDARYLFDNENDRLTFIPCAINYIHQMIKRNIF